MFCRHRMQCVVFGGLTCDHSVNTEYNVLFFVHPNMSILLKQNALWTNIMLERINRQKIRRCWSLFITKSKWAFSPNRIPCVVFGSLICEYLVDAECTISFFVDYNMTFCQQRAHFNIMHLYNNVFCAYTMLMIHFGLIQRDKVAGTGMEGVNLSPGFGHRSSLWLYTLGALKASADIPFGHVCRLSYDNFGCSDDIGSHVQLC